MKKYNNPNTAAPARKSAIDIKNLVIDDTPLHNDKGEQPAGAKGGKGEATSNTSFVAAVFRDLPEGAKTVVCSKTGDPTAGAWHASAANDVDRQCPASRNNYINCSSFYQDGNGELKARKEQFAAYHALVFDDVGTKAERGKFATLTPSWEIETSPGNSQIGIILTEPLRDDRLIKQLQDAVMAAGLCDPGAGGLARWARLPIAINGKAKYCATDGTPFACRLVQWNPDVRMKPEEIAQALGFSLLPPSPSSAPRPQLKEVRFPTRTGNDIYQPAPFINPVLAALNEKGLYKKPLSDGRHDITCPWVNEHTDGLDSGCGYFEPSRDYPTGGFRCQHSHGDRYHISDLLSHLDVSEDAARCKPSIYMKPGETHRVARTAEMVLADMGGRFQAGGRIVRLVVDPVSGEVRTAAINEQSLARDLSEAADWYQGEKGGKGKTRIDPQAKIVTMLLKAEEYEYLPVLCGVARQPYFAEGGKLLVSEPGYNPVTKLYGEFDPAAFPLPEPTIENAHIALSALRELLCEFHFASDTDLSAALSSILTAAIRPSLPVAPAFNITASGPGSGKSYLSTLVARFAGPGDATITSYPAAKDEAEKQMLALLMDSPAVIIFDDMQGPWHPYSKINSALTSPVINGRILGSSKTVTVSTASLIMGSGNNIYPAKDMCRRVVSIRLTPPAQTAVTWSYKFDPVNAVSSTRGSYVAHALTIIRAWIAAGSPKVDVSPIATYGDWSDYCRHPLLWLDLPDPATSLIDQVLNDPEVAQLGELLKEWHGIFGEGSVTVRKLLDKAANHLVLDDLLSELPVTDKGIVNPARLGWYLSKHKDRIIDDLQLRDGTLTERKSWRVVKVEKGEAPSSPPLTSLAA